MSTNFDAGAFVINKDAGSQSAGSTTILSVAPCDLDIAGFAVYQTASTSSASSFNIKVTPPVQPAVYARTYNYNYATAKNVSVTSISSDLATLTFTTASAHSYSAGDVVSVTGSTLGFLNLKDAVIDTATPGTTTFTVKYPEVTASATHPGTKVLVADVNTTVQTINSVAHATYTTAIAHGLKTGDKVTVTGTTTAARDIATATAVIVTGPTTFQVPSSVAAGAVGASAYINITVVNTQAYPIFVTKGQVVDAVQLVGDPDVNRAPDYTLATTASYAFTSDQVLRAGVKGAQFGAATGLGNGSDSRLAGKIPAGSKVEVEMLVAGATVAGLTYSVEFKKK